MRQCPQCHTRLADDVERTGVCPGCGANLFATSDIANLPESAERIANLAGTLQFELNEPNEPSEPNNVSANATLGLPSPGETNTVDLKQIEATWQGVCLNSAPTVTIKATLEPAATTSRSSLVVRDREVREVDTEELAVADYDLLDQLGEGGMGVVYTARQASIDRTVAVKMLKPRIAKDEQQKRKFLSEAVVTGELDHPNIVPIYELGRNTDGSLFYSMKKVQGTPWMDVLPNRSLAENLEILMKVADAVAFAHSRGVVHRDLKPENIMLGEFGEVLVLDWGLALTTSQCRKSAELMGPAGMGGTPAYMAPEMVLGPIEKIGVHSDIYLLGAMLYECVTGAPPHDGDTLMQCLRAASTNQIRPAHQRGELVDIALKAMSTEPAERFASVRQFQQVIRTYQSHSESIALTARASDELARAIDNDDYHDFARALYVFEEASELWPDNRPAVEGVSRAKLAYANSAYRKGDYDLGASILSPDDPQHHELNLQLRQAQRERNARQQRLRNAKRAIAALAALVFIAVTLGMLLFHIQKQEADRQRAMAVANEGEAKHQRDEAQRQRSIAEGNADEARRQEQFATDQRSRAERSEQDAIAKRELAEYEAYLAWIGLADSKIKANALGQARSVLAQCTEGLRDWEWYRLMYQCRQGLGRIQVDQRMDCVAVSLDGAYVAAGSRDGLVRVWDARTGEALNELDVENSFATSIAFSPTSRSLLAVGSGDPEKFVQLWDMQSGQVLTMPNEHTDRVTSVAFSADGQSLLTASLDNAVIVWNLQQQRAAHILKGHSWWVWSAQYSRDGRWIVTASQDGTVRIWDASSGQQWRNAANEPTPFRGHEGPVYSASFSPDGQCVASGGYDGRILLWSPADLQAFDYQQLLRGGPQPALDPQPLAGHSAAVSRVVFSRDGHLLISAGHDNRIMIWSARDQMIDGDRFSRGALYKTLRGHDSLVRDVACSPQDDDLVISASYDGQLRLWGIRDYTEELVIPGVVLRGHSDAILQASFSPNNDRIVTASRDRSARVWNSQDGAAELLLQEGHAYLTSSAAFFPPEQRSLLTAAVDGTARVWNLDTGTQEMIFSGIGPTAAATVSPDGRWVATSAKREAPDDDAARDVTAPSPPRVAKLWDARTGEVVHVLADHQAAVTALAFSADSQWLFTGDANGRGNLWHVESGRHLATARRHTGRISAATFAPAGDWLLTGSEDKTVFQWDLAPLRDSSSAEPWQLVADATRILRHPAAVTSLALTTDGRRLLTSCQDGTARLWNCLTADVVWEWSTDERGTINAVDISPQSPLALVVDSVENVVCLLDLETGLEVRVPTDDGAVGHFLNLNQSGAVGWSARFSPSGDHVVTLGGDEARLWDLQGRERMSFGSRRTVSSASFSPDGARIVTSSWDNSAKLWDALRGTPLLKLDNHVAGPRLGHQARVNSATFSPSGDQIVTASDDGTLKIWNAQTGQVLHSLDGHQGPVTHAAYSADGRYIVSSSRDATAAIWNAQTGALVHCLQGHRMAVLNAAFSADASQVVTGGEDHRAIIWNVDTGEQRIALPDQTDRVTSVAFAPSGARVLTGCGDHSIKLWDATTGREILTLSGHTREVTSVAFSADGRLVLSSSRDGTAIVWPSTLRSDDGQYELDVPRLGMRSSRDRGER